PELHYFVVGDVVEESAVVVHDRWNNPGRPIGWRGHHSTTRSIFLVDGECIQVDPFDTAQRIVGISSALRDATLGELLIQLGGPSGQFLTTRKRGLGSFNNSLNAVLYDLTDIPDFVTNFFWIVLLYLLLPNQLFTITKLFIT